MAEPTENLDARMARIDARTYELCDEDLWDPAAAALARAVWLDGTDTRIGCVSKERMLAFAEELYGRRHPGAPGSATAAIACEVPELDL